VYGGLTTLPKLKLEIIRVVVYAVPSPDFDIECPKAIIIIII